MSFLSFSDACDEGSNSTRPSLIPSTPQLGALDSSSCYPLSAIEHLYHQPVPEFLFQLTKMLRENNREIIEWDKGEIIVHDPRKLQDEVLHKYFRHSKFSSFQRQLNYFGFRKLSGKGKMAPCKYLNNNITSDIGSLLTIKRKTHGCSSRKNKSGSNLRKNKCFDGTRKNNIGRTSQQRFEEAEQHREFVCKNHSSTNDISILHGKNETTVAEFASSSSEGFENSIDISSVTKEQLLPAPMDERFLPLSPLLVDATSCISSVETTPNLFIDFTDVSTKSSAETENQAAFCDHRLISSLPMRESELSQSTVPTQQQKQNDLFSATENASLKTIQMFEPTPLDEMKSNKNCSALDTNHFFAVA